MTARASRLTLRQWHATRSATWVWLFIVIAAAFATAIASMHLTTNRDAAMARARDLAVCRADLSDLDAWHVNVRAGGDSTSADPELNRRIRAAATSASLLEQIASIEPGPSIRLRESDVMRTPIYLRFDGVTVRQVAAFVSAAMTNDSSLKATGIEFSAPPTATLKTGGDELWTADVTLSESTMGPHVASP